LGVGDADLVKVRIECIVGCCIDVQSGECDLRRRDGPLRRCRRVGRAFGRMVVVEVEVVMVDIACSCACSVWKFWMDIEPCTRSLRR
jgi:hypothetical protein